MVTRKILYPVVLCALLSQGFCLGADYYVDAASGNDGNAGTSTTSAWRTVSKVNSRSFAAGDRILFKRGQTWREQLIVPSSGVSGRPITFGAYGTGERPCLKGSALASGWTSQSSTVWRGSLGSAPNQVFFSGVRGTKVSGISSVNSARKWYWSSGTLYVYATSNPGNTVEASVRPSVRSYGLVNVAGREYVNIESLEVTQSASFGLYIKAPSRYVTVRDCDVSHALDGGLVAPSSGGVGPTQLTVEDCLVHHNNGGYKEGAPGVATYHEGLTMENVDGFVIRRTKVYNNYMEGSNFKRGARNGVIEYCDLYANDLINQYIEGATNIEIRYNRIYDCSYNAGIEFGMETSTNHNDNVKIHHNLFWNNSGGVSFWAGSFTGQHRNFRIENNTFYNNWEAIRWKAGATDNVSGTNYIRNNLFWQGSASNRAIWDYTSGQQAISRTTIAYNAFQQGAASATTGSSGRMLSDSGMVNPGGRDFHLRSGAACINTGTSIGWTRDFEGTSIPQGGVPDIGADEYGAGTTPTPTTYTLSVSATNGTVTRTPNQSTYTAGQTVTLQATPNTGYTFSGWSGALSGTANPATLVMDSNKSVTANFTASGGGGTGGTTGKTVGNTTVFSQIATTSNRRAAPYTMPEAGQLQSVSIYHGGGSGQMMLAVYGDSAGKPGTRLGVTSATTVRSTAGWQTIALQSPVSASSGQKVWLAWVFQNSTQIRCVAGTPGRAESTGTWTGGMPTTFGTSTVANYIYSVYANYSAGTGGGVVTTKTVGNTTVFSGTATSGNRRAVSYTMPEAGQLQSASVFHYGGAGQVMLAVYNDSLGKPGTRLGVTAATTVKSTEGWQTVALQSPVSVNAGQKIWLAWVFQYAIGVPATAGTPGRADSTATWSGGMPTTFGTSTVGNYIYSVYATYSTGSVAALTAPSIEGPESLTQTVVDAAERDDVSVPHMAPEAWTRDLAAGRGVCVAPTGLNQGNPALVADAQGNTWVVWHAGDAGERQVYAGFFPGLSPVRRFS